MRRWSVASGIVQPLKAAHCGRYMDKLKRLEFVLNVALFFAKHKMKKIAQLIIDVYCGRVKSDGAD